jgi:transcriptional regulator GlxA family with amidase domain
MLTEIIKTMPDTDTGEAPEKFRDIRDFLDEHYAEELSLQALSDRFCMSKYHLCREFKKYIGQPPYEYLTGVRINNAKALLRFTDKRIADIACEVGFGDNCHFFSIFERYEALSPAEYRRQWTGSTCAPGANNFPP